MRETLSDLSDARRWQSERLLARLWARRSLVGPQSRATVETSSRDCSSAQAWAERSSSARSWLLLLLSLPIVALLALVVGPDRREE